MRRDASTALYAPRVAARVLLVIVALLLAGWFGVLLRDHEIGKEAALRAYFAPAKSAASRDRDIRRLEDARLLDPSAAWDLALANYRLAAGDVRGATADAEELVRAEPENLAAWGASCGDTAHRSGACPRGRVRDQEAGSARVAPLASAIAISAPASTIAGSVTAGICQSQSMVACSPNTAAPAQAPGASSGCRRSARRPASPRRRRTAPARRSPAARARPASPGAANGLPAQAPGRVVREAIRLGTRQPQRR